MNTVGNTPSLLMNKHLYNNTMMHLSMIEDSVIVFIICIKGYIVHLRYMTILSSIHSILIYIVIMNR